MRRPEDQDALKELLEVLEKAEPGRPTGTVKRITLLEFEANQAFKAVAKLGICILRLQDRLATLEDAQ